MKVLKTLFVVLLLSVAAVNPLGAWIDDPCVQCGFECQGYDEFYLCDRPAAVTTACVRCTPQNCGISVDDSGCGGGRGGF
jgi:hypothetical protein